MISTILSTGLKCLKPVGSYLSHLLTWHAFGVLALLPGFIALLNLTLTAHNFEKAKDEVNSKKNKKLGLIFSQTSSGIEEYRPRIRYTLFGAIFLTAVFEVVAAIGGTGDLPKYDLGVAGVQSKRSDAALEEESGLAPQAERTKNANRGEGDARSGADGQGKQKSPPDDEKKPSTVRGLAGLVFAGYGAYIYTLTLIISRLNSSALTGKFLVVSSVRSAIALILGFAAADTNIFSGLTLNQGLFALFFIGLFPSWAMDAVRRKAQELFKPRDVGCDILPICLIDGLDDGIADRLAEIGVWDIQHIAASDPFVLVAKTFYPIRRVIDWMDQAILISYVREQIIHFRAMGVRGAIDFAALYRDSMALEHGLDEIKNSEAQKAYRHKLEERASEIIKALAQKTSLSEACLNSIGRAMYEDAVVDSIWDLWFTPADSRLELSAQYSPDTDRHLQALTAQRRAIVFDTVDNQLSHQPAIETRNCKPMHRNPVTPWELRIGDLRIYYDVEETPTPRALIRAIGVSRRNGVLIGAEEIQVMTLRMTDIAAATKPLSDYAQTMEEGPLMVTKDGQPIAVVISVENADLETVSLSTHPGFLKLIERSRTRQKREGGLSSAEMRARFASEP